MKELFRRFKNKMKGEIPLNEGQIKDILADENIVISEDTKRENRIPPGQHEVKKWPVLHAGSVRNIDTSKWKFRIFGLVEEEKKFKLYGFHVTS